MARAPRDPIVRHPADRLGVRAGLGLLLLLGLAAGSVAFAMHAPMADKTNPRPRHVRTYMGYPGILYIPGRGMPRHLRGGGPGLGK